MPFSTVHRLFAAVCLLASSLATPALALAADSAAVDLGGGDSVVVALDEQTEKVRKQLEAGIRFENGEGVAQDYAKARALYCDAARSDYPDALIRLGWLYANGRGVNRNDMIAATLFQRAATLGSDMASQLMMLFRTTSNQMPPCLGGSADTEQSASLPGPAAANGNRGTVNYSNGGARVNYNSAGNGVYGGTAGASGVFAPTPVIEAPAVFKTAPVAIERRRVVELVVQLAKQLKLDPRLVLALIGTESGFDPNAKSNKNAQGLMQLIPDTGERFGVKDLFDPLENLRGGMSYLRWLLAYYRGDVVLAVAAYNAGEGAVDKFKGVPPFAETLAYVQRIRAFYPFDFHPFDAAATGPSAILRIGRDIGREASRDGITGPAAPRLPRS